MNEQCKPYNPHWHLGSNSTISICRGFVVRPIEASEVSALCACDSPAAYDIRVLIDWILIGRRCRTSYCWLLCYSSYTPSSECRSAPYKPCHGRLFPL